MAAKKKAAKKAAKKTSKKASKKVAKKAAPANSECKVVTVQAPRGGKKYKRKLCWGMASAKALPARRLVIVDNQPAR